MGSEKQTRILRFADVILQIGLSRSQIRRLELAGKFPRKIRLGPHSIGYFAHEVEDFLDELSSRRAIR